VSDSVAAGNGGGGFTVSSITGKAPASLMLFHSVSTHNGDGVVAFNTGATLRLANSTVTGNTNGWFVSGSGVVNSYGDNYVDGNTSDETAPPSIVRK